MGLFSWLRRAAGGSLDRAFYTNLSQWRKPPKRTTAGILQAYGKSPWLRAVASKVGDAVASTRWYLTAPRANVGNIEQARVRWSPVRKRHAATRSLAGRGLVEVIEEHDLLSLLARPNPLFSGGSILKLAQLYLDLVGEVWLLKDTRDPRQVPVALWPIPPTSVIGRPTPDDPEVELSLGGWQGKVPSEMFVWSVTPDPVDPYGRGTSMAEALADDLDIDEYSAKFTKTFFFNRALPPVLIAGQGLARTDADLQRLEEAWTQKVSGFWNSFKPFFLSKEVQVHNLAQSMQQMQLGDLRSAERDTIIHVYGLPPEVFGIVENSNRATIDAADYLLARWVLVPRLELLRSILQVQLVEPYDPRMILEYESPVTEDKAFALEVMRAAPHAFTIDEYRALAGEAPWGPEAGGNLVVLDPSRELVTPEEIGGRAIGVAAEEEIEDLDASLAEGEGAEEALEQ